MLEALTGDPPRRSRHRDHLPRKGRRRMASVSGAQGPQPQGRRRRPARRARQAAAQPDAGQLPARAAPVRARGRAGRGARGRGDAPGPAAARRAHHPPGHADLRHAGAGLRVDAGGRQGRPREPAPRRQDHQLAPGRVAQLPAQPRLQPVVHDRHRAGLEARPAGHAGRAQRAHRRRVGAPAAHAQAVQDPDGPGDGEGHADLAARRRGPGPDGARRRSSCPTSTTR